MRSNGAENTDFRVPIYSGVDSLIMDAQTKSITCAMLARDPLHRYKHPWPVIFNIRFDCT